MESGSSLLASARRALRALLRGRTSSFDVLDSYRSPAWIAVIYSVRRRKLAPDVAEFGFPRVERGRNSGLSCGCGGGGFSRACIAIQDKKDVSPPE